MTYKSAVRPSLLMRQSSVGKGASEFQPAVELWQLAVSTPPLLQEGLRATVMA